MQREAGLSFDGTSMGPGGLPNRPILIELDRAAKAPKLGAGARSSRRCGMGDLGT
jgi:hypothetical protein